MSGVHDAVCSSAQENPGISGTSTAPTRTVISGPEHRKCNRAASTHRVRRVSRRW